VTKAEFFQCLHDSRDKFVWTITGSSKRIRGILLENYSMAGNFCPVTAVCFLKTGNKYEAHAFSKAIDDLELGIELNGVMNAADQIYGVDMKLRHEIEEAVFGKVVTK
jgi:hypothetical protein